jgi:hypothetical protein
MRHECALVTILLSVLGAVGTPAEKKEAAIDTADYFLQDDPDNRWRLDRRDIVKAGDPEGTKRRTVIMGKHGSADSYEVFYVTDKEIQLRYEVHKRKRIRRFQEIGPGREKTTDGYVWLKRRLVPGGKGWLTRIVHDDFLYNREKGKFVYDKSPGNFIHRSVDWAVIDWGLRNRTGLKLNKVLRVTSEWQPEGKVIEQYDYAKGVGLVNWRWLESIEFMKGKPPVKTVKSAPVVAASSRHVLIEDPGKGDKAPVAHSYNLASNKKGRRLDTVKWENYWIRKKHGRLPASASGWYVVVRDLSQEHALRKVTTTLNYDYFLKSGEKGPTIADLPYVKTTPPKHMSRAEVLKKWKKYAPSD